MIANANSIEQLVNPSKNGIMKHANVSVKIILPAKKIIAGMLAHARICENKYLKSAVDDSKTVCGEIIWHGYCINKKDKYYSYKCVNKPSKKLRCKIDSYILYPLSIVIILLQIIAIFHYHYAKHWSKRHFYTLTI